MFGVPQFHVALRIGAPTARPRAEIFADIAPRGTVARGHRLSPTVRRQRALAAVKLIRTPRVRPPRARLPDTGDSSPSSAARAPLRARHRDVVSAYSPNAHSLKSDGALTRVTRSLARARRAFVRSTSDATLAIKERSAIGPLIGRFERSNAVRRLWPFR